MTTCKAHGGITGQKWEDFLHVLQTGTANDQRRWICWFINHMTQCDPCVSCPGNDPFAN